MKTGKVVDVIVTVIWAGCILGAMVVLYIVIEVLKK